MLLRCAIDQGVDEEGSGSEIDHRRASDPNRIDVTARKTGSNGRAYVALPNHCSGRGVERINVIRFGDGNNHRPTETALDVQRLPVNVPGNRAVEVKVTSQASSSRRRKSCVDVDAVAGKIVVLLSDVHLRVCRKN